MSLTPLPTLDQLAADPARVRDLPPEVARDLLPRIIGLQTALLAQTLSPSASGDGQPEVPAEDLQLLKASEVASLLDLPKARVYELIRHGQLPAVRVGEKHVRVPRTSLREWIAQHQEKGVDTQVSQMLTSPHEGFRDSPNPTTARAHAASVRQAGRRSLRDRKPLGAGQEAHPGTRGPAHPAPGEDNR